MNLTSYQFNIFIYLHSSSFSLVPHSFFVWIIVLTQSLHKKIQNAGNQQNSNYFYNTVDLKYVSGKLHEELIQTIKIEQRTEHYVHNMSEPIGGNLLPTCLGENVLTITKTFLAK